MGLQRNTIYAYFNELLTFKQTWFGEMKSLNLKMGQKGFVYHVVKVWRISKY